MSPRVAAAPSEDTWMTSLDMLDHKAVSWNEVERSAYLIHQTFHYEYTGPIRQLNQRLVIIPAVRHGDQRLVTHRLEVSSPTTEINQEIDRFGNLVISLAVDYVAKAIDFTAWIVVERTRTGQLPLVTGEMAPHLEATRLTTPDTALRAAAAELRADGATGSALADRINAWVYGQMRYAHDVTGVGTPAAAAFALKSGVCQDYAQVMLVLCRLCGLPARYVSGHMLGEGGTHAWVEVLLPDPANSSQLLAHPYDPTHGRMADLRYVTVATGRDYGDVAPTSGTYVAPHAGTLSASKRAGLTEVQYAADRTIILRSGCPSARRGAAPRRRRRCGW